MKKIEIFQRQIKDYLEDLDFEKSPPELYQPMKYAITMGGKRLRPLLTLIACDMFGGKTEKALHAAVAFEIFHNFTLVHDDIMDKAPLRRGKETIYQKWNQNIGILSGDALLAMAFDVLSHSSRQHLTKLVGILSKVAIEVCEGQQLDINFETSDQVSISDYINMIKLKTAVLTANALKAGAIIAGATDTDCNLIYDFGINLGIAFQIKDDLLDVYGSEQKFGKKIGGDILAHKKTILFVLACETDDGVLKKDFLNSYLLNNKTDTERIKKVVNIFDILTVKSRAEKMMDDYYKQAIRSINKIKIKATSKTELHSIAKELMSREF